MSTALPEFLAPTTPSNKASSYCLPLYQSLTKMTEYHDLYSTNYPLLSRDFENDLDALSASIYDDDLIPILDREDDSDLSHYESSRCSSISSPSLEWTCPLKDSFPPCNRLFSNVAYQIPPAPPPTPLPASPTVLPTLYNEEGGVELEVPTFELSTSLKELGVCAAMGNRALLTRPWWDIKNVEGSHLYSVGDMPKRTPESWSFPCAFCEESSNLHRATFHDQATDSPIEIFREHKTFESQLYQFPPLNSYDHPCYSPPTPPPSACSSRGSLDEDQEAITLYSFIRQPYSMVEIDYQLQLLSIQQQADHTEEHMADFMSISRLGKPKRGGRLRKASLGSIEKAGGTLKRKISNAIKRSLSL